MGLNAVRNLTFTNSGDLSNATVSSEIVECMDLRNFAVVITTTGAPTGSLAVIHYYGLPQPQPNGSKAWVGNPTYTEQTFAPAGTATSYKHTVSASSGQPCSGYQLVYTRTSGTGTIKAIQQAKGGGT